MENGQVVIRNAAPIASEASHGVYKVTVVG